jgi:hypothetical protein
MEVRRYLFDSQDPTLHEKSGLDLRFMQRRERSAGPRRIRLSPEVVMLLQRHKTSMYTFVVNCTTAVGVLFCITRDVSNDPCARTSINVWNAFVQILRAAPRAAD